MTPGPIIDEFTDLPIDRRRKYQLRMAKQKRCVNCGKKATRNLTAGDNNPLCERDWKRFKQRKRNTMRKKRASGD